MHSSNAKNDERRPVDKAQIRKINFTRLRKEIKAEGDDKSKTNLNNTL